MDGGHDNDMNATRRDAATSPVEMALIWVWMWVWMTKR